jgi:hypothetical protein
MDEGDYKKLWQRIATHQKNLMSHADAKDDLSSVEKRLADLLETAKRRIVRLHGGQ